MPTLQRYKKLYQDRIPSVGEGRTQRYPREAMPVIVALKKENIKKRGRRAAAGDGRKKPAGGAPKRASKRAGRRKAARKSARRKPVARKTASKTVPTELLTLSEINRRTGISYPTLLRYVKLHLRKLPHVGKGRKRRYHEEADAAFEKLRASTRRGRKKKEPARAAAAGDASNAALKQRIEQLEKAQTEVAKQLKAVVKQLQKPLRVTVGRG